MGMYINPQDMTKEEFLQKYGLEITQQQAHDSFPIDKVYPVCLVNNGGFTAAAIAYCIEEYQELTKPHDVRPKKWFAVHEDDLKPYMANLESYLKNLHGK